MSNSSDESNEPSAAGGPGISDEQLPEDLRPTDDNPLAKSPEQGGEDKQDASTGGPMGGADTGIGDPGAAPPTENP